VLCSIVSRYYVLIEARVNDPKSREHSMTAFLQTSETALNSSSDSLFDYYVLSMSYQPEFCYLHRHEMFSGCEKPNEFWKGSLTIHGLWPQRRDGTWPSTCSNEKFDESTLSDLGRERFATFWPNVKVSMGSPGFTSFWEHEWTKHGTCSGLTQDNYFNTALTHFLPTPDIVEEYYGRGESILTKDLENAYIHDDDNGDVSKKNHVVLVCSRNGKYLSEVRICVGKNSDGSASRRIMCEPSVIKEGNCDDEIFIPKFYIDNAWQFNQTFSALIKSE